MSTSTALHNSYTGSEWVNLEKIRADAIKRATVSDLTGKTESTMIHYHLHGEHCDLFGHEYVRNLDGVQTVYTAKADTTKGVSS